MYVEDFHGAVVAFLAFHQNHVDLADRLAKAVTAHATPVGSRTVARTKRIPVEHRAEAAVIAWMRHRTTGYDGMAIARVKGERREVRRKLARRSHELLARYRRGESIPTECPLAKTLADRTPESHRGVVKIATYNLRKGGSRILHWAKLLEAHTIDLLFIQESNPHGQHLPGLLYPDVRDRCAWQMVDGQSRLAPLSTHCPGPS